jgi:branched-chain amino acid transport system permease protein
MTIENYFAQTGAWVTIITGAIFVVCVLMFRRGIVGEFGRLFHRRMANLNGRTEAHTLRPAE